MRVGLFVSTAAPSLESMTGQVRAAAEAGLDSAFFTQLTSWDALTVAALAGQSVPEIELGTAVVATYPRHPLALAGQALTTQAALGGRLTLGVGPSHPAVIEGQFGLSYARPARHMREYLSALVPLLHGETVDYRGETLTAAGNVDVPVKPPSVLVSALGPAMLRIAGELADGTVAVWTGPAGIADLVRPALGSGKRVVAVVLACVTADADAAIAPVAGALAASSDLPAYRAHLDRQGLSSVTDLLVAGDESTVAAALRRYADAGATELLVSPFGSPADQARTLSLLR
ncbi:TIGR03564 family F420-dependent LLM class oxidoreductase [Fodinicola acaciae]|uniref:TIGR03564 family F420-dependent LLM class oxidoreductase n=1 Tax=Fodinicola acaciae TaxID=2681555 RepID=UPI0013D4ACA0|nr:TIGR03564 family F420-dependent LLM class oxidoreductase [Fodinicola acaciae]